jgi:hypothetical protein
MATYATFEQLQGFLHQLKEADQARAEEFLTYATAAVNDELKGVVFADYGEAEPHDVHAGAGGSYLYLPAYEAGSVASVYAVSYRGQAGEVATEVTDYVEETRWRLYRAVGWARGGWYRVTAAWGPGPAPDSIVRVTCEVARNMWLGRDSSSMTTVGGAAGEGAVVYNRALTWEQRSAIRAVREQYARALR